MRPPANINYASGPTACFLFHQEPPPSRKMCSKYFEVMLTFCGYIHTSRHSTHFYWKGPNTIYSSLTRHCRLMRHRGGPILLGSNNFKVVRFVKKNWSAMWIRLTLPPQTFQHIFSKTTQWNKKRTVRGAVSVLSFYDFGNIALHRCKKKCECLEVWFLY